MRPNVVSEEYLTLQKGIIKEQENLKDQLSEKMKLAINKETIDLSKPVIAQFSESPIPVDFYRDSIDKIADVISEQNEQVLKQVQQLKDLLTDDVLNDWIKAAVTFDADYFEQFSEKNNVVAWLPYFVAEQALRPFLQVIGKHCHMFINEMEVMGACPCCGEPARIAKLDKEREKYVICPRCESEWKQNRLSCVHCGNNKHEQLFYIEVEEDEMAKIEVCKTCRNYTKLVDTSKLIKQKPASLLDLETIHLDFIAQEEGHGEEAN